MAHCIVTGAAGFVGSHLCEELIARGHRVTGIDAFIPYYPRPLKEGNLAGLRQGERFTFYEADLRSADLRPLLAGAGAVFHLAAMAGLLRSWQEFESYTTCNVLATQRLLAAAVESRRPHLLHISTSSVYGRFATGDETAPLAPISPYGITKLAAEHLCRLCRQPRPARHDLAPLFRLRPAQRPDMGYNIFIRSILNQELITVDGDGRTAAATPM